MTNLKLNWRALAAAISLLIVIMLITFFSRDFIRESIVFPIRYITWLGSLIVQSIDQEIVWLILVAIGAFLTFQLLVQQQRKTSHRLTIPNDWSRPGQTSSWNSYLNLMLDGTYSDRFFKHELRKLTLNVLSQRHHLPPKDVERLIYEEQIFIPAHIRGYLFSSSREANQNTRSKLKIWAVQHIFPSEVEKHRQEKLQNIRQVVEYLQNELEGR